MSNYWIAIVGDKLATLSTEKKLWWCLPLTAKEGDIVLTYCPVSSNVKRQGIFSECSVVLAPQNKHPNNYFCSGFGGELAYAELDLKKLFAVHLVASQMKKDPLLRETSFVRKNFQATTFPIEKSFYKQIDLMLHKLNE